MIIDSVVVVVTAPIWTDHRDKRGVLLPSTDLFRLWICSPAGLDFWHTVFELNLIAEVD